MAGRRRALIVASDSYENEGLRHLRSPAADAEALSDVLGDPQIGGFEVTVVRNEAAHDIGARIEDLFADSRHNARHNNALHGLIAGWGSEGIRSSTARVRRTPRRAVAPSSVGWSTAVNPTVSGRSGAVP